MGIVKEVTGAVLPYVVIGGVGYLAYRYIARSTVGQTLAELPAKAAEKGEEIASRTPSDWLSRTPIGKAVQGDWPAAVAGLTTPGMIWNLLS